MGRVFPQHGHGGRPLNSGVRHQLRMIHTFRRIAIIGAVSVIAPIVFFAGAQFEIPGLFDWPQWLPYIWPTSLMFIACQPCTGHWAVEIFFISAAANAVIWAVVGLVVWWLAVDLPKSLARRKQADA